MAALAIAVCAQSTRVRCYARLLLRSHPFVVLVEITLQAAMPLTLKNGWNRLSIDLEDIVRRAFGTSHQTATRVRIHANCRLAKVYFQDR